MAIDYDRVEFADNPEPRCPCILLLDTSGSMRGSPIDELNAGLQVFKEAFVQDELATLRVEIAIISFGPVAIEQDFVTVSQFTPPVLEAEGDTPMGEALDLALDKIEERKSLYKQNGIPYYRPWIFLITDGAPTDRPKSKWKNAAERARKAEENNKVVLFAVGVEGANMEILGQIAARQPLRLMGLNFQSMFQWLSSSLTSVSHSHIDDEVPLQSPLGWGSV